MMKVRLYRLIKSKSRHIMRKHATFIIILFALGMLAVIYGNNLFPPFSISEEFINPIRTGSDLSMVAAVALKLNQPGLFPNDMFVRFSYERYPRAYVRLLAAAFKIFRDERIALQVMGLVLNLVFVGGIYFLALRLSSSSGTAFIVALITIGAGELPGFDYGAWGFIPVNKVVAGAIIRALTPFTLLLFLHWRDHRKIMLLFLILGLLAAINPISLILAGGLITVMLFERKGRVLSAIISLVIGSLPFFIRYLPTGALSTPNDLKLVEYRTPGALRPDAHEVIENAFFLFLPAIFGLAGFLRKRRIGLVDNDWFLIHFFAATLLIASAGLLSAFFPFLLRLHLLRSFQYIYLGLIFYSGILIYSLLKQKGRPFKLFGGLALAVFFLPWPNAAYRLVSYARDKTSPSLQVSGYEETEPAVMPEHDWGSFYGLCAWCKENTSVGARFIVPPDDFSIFRVYARRGVVVTPKDGACVQISRDCGSEWLARYKEIQQLYANLSQGGILVAAKKYNAGFIVVEGEAKGVALPVAFKNRRYTVYSIRY